MKDGIIVLNKPQHWTSHDCVAVVRKATGVKRVGHGGTLDPMAEGVLPVFIGKAARIMEYLDADYKTYVCKVRLGVKTDTQDIWGQLLAVGDTSAIGFEEVKAALLSFTGEIEQIPPKYSALKINGKKLYEYAREGKDVEIKPRKIHVAHIKVLSEKLERAEKSGSAETEVSAGSMEFPGAAEAGGHVELTFEVKCSKGTYIRTICHDLGEKLGCGAAMAALTRTKSGTFDLENALSPEEIKTMSEEDIFDTLIAADKPLVNLGIAGMESDRAAYFCRGNSIRWEQVTVEKAPEDLGAYVNGKGIPFDRIYRVYDLGTEDFLGTGYYDDKEQVLKADKVFA
ncbi:MAG: tRNA pseudouridine(55) synthase TruB [Bacillota bacterium]|nr:tRNA pseudouridine(55) synthase TruB [Bacillota bacterium]